MDSPRVVVLARRLVAGLGAVAFVILLVLAFSNNRDGMRAFASLLGPCVTVVLVAMWLSMIVIAALIPPPRKLSDQSALVARVITLAKAVWVVFVFVAGAAWGGFIGVVFSMIKTERWVVQPFDVMGQYVWPPVCMAAAMVSWYTVMACAFDVWRTRDSGKRAVLKRLLCRAHPELPDTPVGQLLSAFMLWTCRGWTPWVIGWLSPPILMSVLVLVWPRLLS